MDRFHERPSVAWRAKRPVRIKEQVLYEHLRKYRILSETHMGVPNSLSDSQNKELFFREELRDRPCRLLQYLAITICR